MKARAKAGGTEGWISTLKVDTSARSSHQQTEARMLGRIFKTVANEYLRNRRV